MDDVGDYMSAPPLSVESESSVQEAAQYMQAQNVGSLLVKSLDDYIGIITETDITRKCVAVGKSPEEMLVAEMMTSPVKSMDRYLPVEEANEFMRKNKIRHLAVTEEDKIVGMLSIRDLVSFFVKSFRTTE